MQLSALLQYRRWVTKGLKWRRRNQRFLRSKGTQDTLLTRADDREVRDSLSAIILMVEQNRMKERFEASPILTSRTLRDLAIIDELIKGLSPESAAPLWEGQLNILDSLDDTNSSLKLRQDLMSRRSQSENMKRINESLSAGVDNVCEDEPGDIASTSQ